MHSSYFWKLFSKNKLLFSFTKKSYRKVGSKNSSSLVSFLKDHQPTPIPSMGCWIHFKCIVQALSLLGHQHKSYDGFQTQSRISLRGNWNILSLWSPQNSKEIILLCKYLFGENEFLVLSSHAHHMVSRIPTPEFEIFSWSAYVVRNRNFVIKPCLLVSIDFWKRISRFTQTMWRLVYLRPFKVFTR